MTKHNVKMRKEKHRHHIVGINIFGIYISTLGNVQWRRWLIEEFGRYSLASLFVNL